MRVAIVHYWLVSMRGGEKVLEALSDLYPSADIFTLVLDEQAISDKLRRHNIYTSFLQKVPSSTRRYKSLLPLMPFALEQFDLSAYDLILSSESGPAKGIIPKPDALHICYCHSPMRYIWDHYHQYRAQAGTLVRGMMPLIAPLLRQWDVSTAARVDYFIANSNHVANRINRFYRRQATVIHPPVSVNDFTISPDTDNFYLCAGQLVGYKRVDLAVEAFTRMGRNLVVVGEGEELDRLRALAGPTVKLVGRQPFPALKNYLARCRALVFPGEEDFGIVPIEAMASGRPVIAYDLGGARETVRPGVSGLMFKDQTVEALIGAVEQFEMISDQFDPHAIRAHATAFDESIFRYRMRNFIDHASSLHWPQSASTKAPAGYDAVLGQEAAPFGRQFAFKATVL